jgi:hypothetical protein
MEVLRKLTTELPCDAAASLLGIFPVIINTPAHPYLLQHYSQ